MDTLGRRRFLKVCAAGGVASSVGLAGCSQVSEVRDIIGGDDTENDPVTETVTETETEPESGSWEVLDNLYVPDVHENFDHYGYFYTSPGTVANHETALAEDFVESFASVEDRFEELGLDFDSISDVVYYDHGQSAVAGDIPVDAVAENLDEMGFQPRPDKADFAVFASSENRSTIAVSEDLLLMNRPVGSMDAGTVLETAINTREGDTERYIDAYPAFASVRDALGDPVVEVGRTQEPPSNSNPSTGRFNGVIAKGMGISIADSVSTAKMAFEFDDGGTEAADAIEQWIKEHDDLQEPFAAIEAVDTEATETEVVVTGEIPTEALQPDIFTFF